MEVWKSSCIKVFWEDFSFNQNLLQPVQKSSGRICFFSLNSWSLQNTHVTQVPFIAPSCFSSNPKFSRHLLNISSQTVPTRQTRGEPPVVFAASSPSSSIGLLQTGASDSVPSLWPQDECRSERADRRDHLEMSSLSALLHLPLYLWSKCHDLAALCESTFPVFVFPAWIHRP